ncbi:hypothetical protein IRT45_36000 [Nocardia sp. BSTN01]|uniref:hypothetical protein n=1 Tax=Nocardia sp. BSTN01 TaxID=2783665 RepID=UPI00188E7082|nr:hypothetical protein [Nocardia sp. BSTN01]MBF5002519.1 hypothetical protein [Nocardia sp. BSTN01]
MAWQHGVLRLRGGDRSGGDLGEVAGPATLQPAGQAREPDAADLLWCGITGEQNERALA